MLKRTSGWVIGGLLLLALLATAQDVGTGREIVNPYFERTAWRVWRDDETPMAGVQSMAREEGKEKVVTTILAPPKIRLYPLDPAPEGRFLAYGPLPEASKDHAGIWDDVYSSWSGLHGYVRNRWKGPGGDIGEVLSGIIHFVDVSKRNTLATGVNFIHQSTTGMGHSIANGYMPARTTEFERLYFGDALITGPAHASFTEAVADRTNDLYMALFPTIFNSVGSSNSETMAITKMILAGGYLPPSTKLTLKRSGLYPAAMLYLFKAALPYPYPYDHELRHRIAYKAVGDRSVYPEKYGAAGIERGDLCLAYHCYDDAAHMRRMIELAKSMTAPLPEAVLKIVRVEGGETRYALKKTVLMVQRPGQTVRLQVSTEDCYDLSGRPVEVRFKLLCGNRLSTVERLGDGPEYMVTIPWNENLPQGRTSIALIANNGLFDSNPAVINAYRLKGAIPGPGLSPKDYGYPGKFANLRPVLLGLTDVVAKPGEQARVVLDAVDPEGFPVSFYHRSGDTGELDGNLLTWDCPKDAKPGSHPVTIIASDGTSGNSYVGKTIRFEVGPKIFAHLAADRLAGPAPLTVKVSAEGSFDRAGALKYGWEFYAPAAKRKAKAFKDQQHGAEATHTFAKPGLYEIALTVNGPSGTDTETLSVHVTGAAVPERPAKLGACGNDVALRSGSTTTSAFDHTDFGPAAGGAAVEREFLLLNLGDQPLELAGKDPVTITGPHAGEFQVIRSPRASLEPRGSSRMLLRFSPVGADRRTAIVTVRASGGGEFSFAISGTSRIDQAGLDAAAKPAFEAAKVLFDAEKWGPARAALEEVVKLHPGSTHAAEAKALVAKIDTDPAIQKALAAEKAAGERSAATAKRERQAKSLWTMAENFRQNGRADLAKKNLEKLVRDYPDTSWGKKAKAALEE
jgi:PKD repeat protein